MVDYKNTDNSIATHTKSFLHYRWMSYFFTNKSTTNDLQQRAAWIALALILQALNEIDHNYYLPILQQFTSLPPLLLLLGSFYALWRAIRPAPSPQLVKPSTASQQPRLWQRIVLLLTLILTIPGAIQIGYTTFICFTPPVFTNDGTSLDTNAAILLLSGHNPYTDSNILQIARRWSIQPHWTTPLRQGTFANQLDYPTMDQFQTALDTALKTNDASAFESKVSYPALSFLTLVPFVALHNYNVQPFYLLCYLLLILLAWKWAQPELRPWVILLAIANVPMLASTMGGNLDIFYTLLIALAWWLRDRRWTSALFFGLALASKQIAWYFVPFYFIMNWRLYGLKEAIYRLLIAGTLGLLINLPFIIWNPQAWLAGILAPVIDPMFPMGVGIVNLSVTHLIPYLPERFYTVLQIIAFIASITCYWRISRVRPESAIFFAVLPLFFNWRSLSSYFYCVAFPLFVLMAARVQPQSDIPQQKGTDHPCSPLSTI
jgi:hypothetical protein